jgi:hypothetical protein
MLERIEVFVIAVVFLPMDSGQRPMHGRGKERNEPLDWARINH